MTGLLKRLSFQTGQSRKVTYYRPPIYGKDNYGVEDGSVSAEEIIVPDVRAYVRIKQDKNYVAERAGHNITGVADIYLPNLTTLKNFPNLDQDNNTYFNDIEGFDKIIDYDRTVYQVPTTATGSWISDSAGTFSSDGESITLTVDGDGNLHYTGSANSLEADRITFQLKCSGSVQLDAFDSYHGGVAAADRIKYDNINFALTDNEWVTIDVPFVSGTVAKGTSIYYNGSRKAVTVTSGSAFSASGGYILDFKKFKVDFTATTGDTIKLKNVKYYKSAEWSIHSVNDYNDEYMSLSCHRTSGRRDSRRKAYGTSYNTTN